MLKRNQWCQPALVGAFLNFVLCYGDLAMGKAGQTMVAISIILLIVILATGCGSGIGQKESEWDRLVARCQEVGTEGDLLDLRNTVREVQGYGYPRDEVLGVAYKACSDSCWNNQCIAACSDCVRFIVDLEY